MFSFFLEVLSKGASLFVAVLLLSVSFAPAVSASMDGCNTCSSSGTCSPEDVSVTTTDLVGREEHKAVSNALSNDDVKMLRQELIREGYTPKVSEANAIEVAVKANNETVRKATVVEILFKTHKESVDAKIVFTHNGASEKAVARVMGPASVLEEPMSILEENATYQRIKENLTEQGYRIDEENATVVKSYIPSEYASVPSCIEGEVWCKAIVLVKTKKNNGIRSIIASVCVDKGKVLGIKDAGYWVCFSQCLSEQASFLFFNICWTFCESCLCFPGPVTCGACATCVGAGAGWCSGYCAAGLL